MKNLNVSILLSEMGSGVSLSGAKKTRSGNSQHLESNHNLLPRLSSIPSGRIAATGTTTVTNPSPSTLGSSNRSRHLSMSPIAIPRNTSSRDQLPLNTELSYSAMSLGMNREDIMYNLYYFGAANSSSNFSNIYETVMEETIAAHSASNTPYILHPASASTINQIKSEIFKLENNSIGQEFDCTVCKETITEGSDIVKLPACQHFFHEECIFKWLRMQDWCPICRAAVISSDTTPVKNEVAILPSSLLEINPESS